MKRGYTQAEYRALINRVRSIIPDVSIHCDIIVGFPGESDAQFQDTADLLAELQLDKIHLARYSPRPGTVSARRMTDDVPEEEKRRRYSDRGNPGRRFAAKRCAAGTVSWSKSWWRTSEMTAGSAVRRRGGWSSSLTNGNSKERWSRCKSTMPASGVCLE